MPLSPRFTKDQLQTIIEEAGIYFCACPAQVCQQLLHLIDLYDYQENCLERDGNDAVHTAIAAATVQAHAALEECLDQILTLEGWDRATLKMPAGLRRLRDQSLDG